MINYILIYHIFYSQIVPNFNNPFVISCACINISFLLIAAEWLIFDGKVPTSPKSVDDTTCLGTGFLNRSNELVSLFGVFIDNLRCTTGRRKYITINQPCGTGKTTLARNVLNFKCAYVAEEFEKFATRHCLRNSKMGEIRSTITPRIFSSWSLYEYLTRMITVTIDWRRHEAESDIEETVSKAMWISTLSETLGADPTRVAEYWRMNHEYLSDFTRCYLDLVSLLKVPILFHFDEIQVIEEWNQSIFLKYSSYNGNLNKVKDDSTINTQEEARTRKACEAIWKQSMINLICEELQRQGALCLVTGRSEIFADVNTFLHTRHAQHRITLPVFSIQDLRGVVLKFHFDDNMNVAEALGINACKEDIESVESFGGVSLPISQFASLSKVVDDEGFFLWLQYFTGGVPSMVCRVLKLLYAWKLQVSNFKEDLKEIESKLCREIDFIEANPFPFLNKDDEISSVILETAFKEQKVCTSYRVSGNLSWVHAISKYCLLFLVVRDNIAYLLMPWFWKVQIEAAGVRET